MFESKYAIVFETGNKNKIRIVAEKETAASFKIDRMYPGHSIKYVGRDSENRSLFMLIPTDGKTVVILDKQYTPVKGVSGKFCDSEIGVGIYVIEYENVFGTGDSGPYFTINTQTAEMKEIPDYELMIANLIWCD